MPKTKISEYSSTANSNTDVASINIDEGCAPSGINNAIRAVMGHLKDFQVGTNGDPFNGPHNGTVGATTPASGAFTTLSATGVTTVQAGTVSLPAITTTGDTNTGIFFPAADTIAFTEGGAESMRIDSSGNLGLGATPSAWAAGSKAIQITGNGSIATQGAFDIIANGFNDGTNYNYITSTLASRYTQVNSQHRWFTAPTGTAGSPITFTQAMTLDASGNFLVGQTSSLGKLTLKQPTGSTVIAANIDGSTSSESILLNVSGFGQANVARLALTAPTVDVRPALTFSLFNGGLDGFQERMRITAAGSVGIGTGSTAANARLTVQGGNFAFQSTTTSATTSVGYISGFSDRNSSNYEIGKIDFQTGAFADAGNMLFSTKVGAGSLTERMRIDSTGNVSIGVATASTLLTLQKTSGEMFRAIVSSNTGLYTSIGADGDGGFINGSTNLVLRTGNTERARIDSAGNLGLGVTPNAAWATNRKVIQLGGLAGTVVAFNGTGGSGEQFYNSYFNASSQNIYNATNFAGKSDFNVASAGGFTWQLAPSGTAGNTITFTQAMTLTAAGNLGVGATSPSAKLEVTSSGSASTAILRNTSSTAATYSELFFAPFSGVTAASAAIRSTYSGFNDSSIEFLTTSSTSAPTEKMRIDSAGRVGIGTTSPGVYTLHISNASPSVRISGTSETAAQTQSLFFGTTTYNRSEIRSINVGTQGADLTFLTSPTGSSSVERMRINNGGSLLVGRTTAGLDNGAGLTVLSTGSVQVECTGSSFFNRVGSDGAVLSFRRQNADVGSITVNGSGTLYNVTSDQRLKENIVDASPASALIDAIQVRQYNWKSNGSFQRYGFVAQELVTVAPEAVHQPADPEEMMAVDYSKLVPMLVKEIQSLRQRVAQLESN